MEVYDIVELLIDIPNNRSDALSDPFSNGPVYKGTIGTIIEYYPRTHTGGCVALVEFPQGIIVYCRIKNLVVRQHSNEQK